MLYNRGYKISNENGDILWSGLSDDPIGELHKLHRKCFGDVHDREFRMTPMRRHLKSIFNQGGKVTVEIICPKIGN